MFPHLLDRLMTRAEMAMDETTSVQEDVTVETLIEDVSIDGMCGVY
jgi:mycofactocin precursor